MASLSSPIRPTIDVVARTVSSSAISGGAGGGGGIPGDGGGGGRGGALAIQPQASLVNVERNLEIQTTQNVQQTQEISALRSTVDALRTETTTLNKGLVSISNLIQQDSAVEKQQEAEKAESERKLSETNVRLGKESQLEQRITNSLATPVQALQQKVDNIFARIGEALTTLFAGWLTNQGIEALKAASEGNKEKLEEIKDNVLNGIGDAIKVFTAIKTGFDLVIKTITGVAARIVGFVTKLALAPIKALTNTLRGAPLLQNVFPGPKKPGGGGGRGLLGGVITGISGTLNFLNGENADAALAGISLLPLPGKVGLGVKVLAGGIFAIDDVLEVFDKNFIGADPKALAAKKKELEEAKRNQTNQKSTSATSTTAEKVTSTSTAQTPMMGDKNKKDGVEANVASGSIPSDSKGINPTSSAGSSASSTGTSAPSTTSTTSGSSSSSTAQTPMMSPSSAATTAPPEAESQTSMAPQASELSLNNPPGALVPGQRPDKALNSEQFKAATQAREEAKVKGLTGKEYDVYVANAAMNAKPSDVNISSPAQVQPLPKPTQNVGELSEPAPNVVMMPSGQSNNQQSSISQAPTNGTDTPLISSSNPDNFYVLYSQLNYNVVI
jgi:uncharacterized spore protein YtfJ